MKLAYQFSISLLIVLTFSACTQQPAELAGESRRIAVIPGTEAAPAVVSEAQEEAGPPPADPTAPPPVAPPADSTAEEPAPTAAAPAAEAPTREPTVVPSPEAVVPSAAAAKDLQRGEALLLLGRPREAVQALTAAVSKDAAGVRAYATEQLAADNSSAHRHFLLGLAHAQLFDYDASRAAFGRAILFSPDPLLAAAFFRSRGQLASQAGEISQALADYDEALARGPAELDVLVYLDRAVALQANDQLAEARAACAAAAAIEPENWQPYACRAYYARLLEDNAAAAADLCQALALVAAQPDETGAAESVTAELAARLEATGLTCQEVAPQP